MYLSADDGTIINIFFLRGLLITSPNLIPTHIVAPEDKPTCHSFCGCHYSGIFNCFMVSCSKNIINNLNI